MMSRPGTLYSTLCSSITGRVFSVIASMGKKEAPICWVIPPASPSCTLVRRILSRIFVLPVSTWPSTQTTGHLRLSFDFFCRFVSICFIRLACAAFFAFLVRLCVLESLFPSESYSLPLPLSSDESSSSFPWSASSSSSQLSWTLASSFASCSAFNLASSSSLFFLSRSSCSALCFCLRSFSSWRISFLESFLVWLFPASFPFSSSSSLSLLIRGGTIPCSSSVLRKASFLACCSFCFFDKSFPSLRSCSSFSFFLSFFNRFLSSSAASISCCKRRASSSSFFLSSSIFRILSSSSRRSLCISCRAASFAFLGLLSPSPFPFFFLFLEDSPAFSSPSPSSSPPPAADAAAAAAFFASCSAFLAAARSSIAFLSASAWSFSACSISGCSTR
mmetsp:Transcript_43126/g.136266  ORF Transcript_43126/g.136266 Transcript_43126/m.136266 type:complete len:390 (-) Transcript_43126:1483-2652(-)